MNSNHRPVIAITMGDAAGIGPETVVKALRERRIYESSIPVVVGDGTVMGRTMRELKSPLKNRLKLYRKQGRKRIINLLDMETQGRKSRRRFSGLR
jgi:4-hydroxy-L-threonine phosphate dehydrogenase PdxA